MRQYRVVINKQQQGPIDEAALVEGYRRGIYPAGTLVWCAGMPDWKPIETVVPAASAPAPARPASGGSAAFEGKVKEFTEKASVFVKDLPAKAKKFTVKQWSIAGGAVAAVLVLVIVLLCLSPKSFKSDQDVKEYLEDRVATVKEFDKEAGKMGKKALPELKKALKKPDEQQEMVLAALMAACGEKGAMKYFFEEKEFSTQAADAAYLAAAAAGHKHVMKSLREYISSEENLAGPAFLAACFTGQVDICKYLVSDGNVDLDGIDFSGALESFGGKIPYEARSFVGDSDKNTLDKNQVLGFMVMIPDEAYKVMAQAFGVARGKKVEKSECMENVAAVAEYLIDQGAEVDMSNELNKEMVKRCPNAALKKLIKK